MGRLHTPDFLTQCDARKAGAPDAAQRKAIRQIDARDETRRAIYCGRPASEGLYVLPFLSNCRSKMITYVFHYLRGSRGQRIYGVHAATGSIFASFLPSA